MVVGFSWGRWVHSGAIWGSLRSFLVVVFVRVQPGGRWVHLGPLGSLKFALVGGGFVQGRWVHSGAPW